METLLTVVVVGLFPCLTLLALLGLTARVERRRAAVIARQIELTDAIHREVGALVAPWVMRRPGGAWRVRIAVPFERPAVVEPLVAGARLAARAVAWLRRLRRRERQVPLTDARGARWPRRAGTS